MKVLIACEESGTVTKYFRLKGHDAYSCDLLPTSGEYPEYHYQQDVVPLLKEPWDLVIAHPPCDHLAVSGSRWFKEKQLDGRQQQAIDFFLQCWNANADKIAIENPVGIMSSQLRKPDCIVHPYHFGDPASKKTCLWLKNLPPLVPTNNVEQDVQYTTISTGKKFSTWEYEISKNRHTRKMMRSKTFDGIAKAMAEQWG
jgi:hypothetical protein